MNLQYKGCEAMGGRKNTKEIMIDNANSIKKSNQLSTAKLNEGLTLNQMQLLAYAIYATQQDGSTTFIKADFEKKFGLDEYRTEHAKDDAQRILSIQVGFEDLENDTFEYWNVFRKMKYDKGTFTFLWDPEITPHILDLKDKYVLTDLTITANFKSGFSWTLYDYLRGLYGAWYISLSKEGVMKLFGVEKKKSYQSNTGLLKKYVLDVAIGEINEFTEVDVKYEEIKKGRAITGFKLLWSTGQKVQKASERQMDILNSIADVTFADAFMYARIKDEVNRERAMQIIRDLQFIQYNYLQPELGLTATKASELIKETRYKLEDLNYLLEMEGIEQSSSFEPVPMINWLEKHKK